MLRSVVAPLYLLLAVGLEFAATFGAAVLVFQHGLGEKGVAFTLPLVLFLFVVAIGTDYNILMSHRRLRGGARRRVQSRSEPLAQSGRSPRRSPPRGWRWPRRST